VPDSAYKACAKCKESKPRSDFHRNKRSGDGLNNECKPCAIRRAGEWQKKNRKRHNENDKRSRQRNPELLRARLGRYKERYPEKYKANKAVWDAVHDGRLVKPACCEDCGKPTPKGELDGHHKDYSKKLEVDWLCRQCHRKRHEDLRGANN
jgi:hypothetical protein